MPAWNLLPKFPTQSLISAKLPTAGPHLHGTRRFVLDRFPFSIVYLDTAEFVNIVAVAHGKPKPG
jgi:hypothetical protein